MTLTYTRPWMPPYQQQLIDDQARIVVTDAATKTGKTVSHLIWLFEQALQGGEGHNFWWVAPTYEQAKSIGYDRMKLYASPRSAFKTNETELKITTPNGAIIRFKTADKPNNLYGQDVYACVCDEATRMKDEAMYAIRSTLTATRGKWRMIGNVYGTQNFAFRLGEKIKANLIPDANHYVFTYEDAVKGGIGSLKELEDARVTFDPDYFKELYYCIPRRAVRKPFAYCFDPEKHVAESFTINYNLPVYLSFDFNVDPIVCLIAQQGHKWIRICTELRIENSNIFELCERLKSLLFEREGPRPRILVTGDASGKARHATSRYRGAYEVIAKMLGVRPSAMHGISGSNPQISETHTVLNGILSNYPEFMISAMDCPYLIEDLEQVEYTEGFGIDKTKDKRQSHLLDALRYYVYNFHRDWWKKSK